MKTAAGKKRNRPGAGSQEPCVHTGQAEQIEQAGRAEQPGKESSTSPPPLPDFIQEAEAGWYLLLRVQPGARKTELCEESDGRLRIRLNAPAVENKANAALLEFVAETVGIKKNKPALAGGEKSRLKKVFIPREAGPDFTGLLGR